MINLLASLMGKGLDFGLGVLQDKYQDKRQLKQNQKLMEQSIAGQKEMGKFNQGMQLDMLRENQNWNSAAAQRKRLEEAGLNVGLMYGGGGAGGSTVSGSAGQAGSAQGGSASEQQNFDIASKVAALKNAESQRKLSDAQARKANAEAAVTESGGEDKQEAEITNLKKEAELKGLQAGFDKLRNEIQANTRYIQEDILLKQLDNLIVDYDIKLKEEEFLDLTLDDRIEMVYQEAVGVEIANRLTSANINKTESEIDKMAEDVAIAWKNSGLIESGQELQRKDLDRKERELLERKHENNIKAFEADVKKEYPSMFNVFGKGFDMFSKLGDRVNQDLNSRGYGYRDRWSPKRD